MRFDLLLLPIVILLLLGGAPPGPDPFRTGGLYGTITDAYGNPLIGATVLLDDGYMGVMTDATGRYRIEDIPEGIYALTAHMVGMEYVVIQYLHIPGDSLLQLDFELRGGQVGGRSTRDILPFTEASISIRFDPPLPDLILSDLVLSIIPGYRYEMGWEMIGDSILRIGAPEGEFSLCWHFPACGVGWLPLHLKESEDHELILPSKPDPIETALGKKVIRTFSGNHPLVLSEFTRDELVYPDYRIERTCIDRFSWGDDSLAEGGLLKFNVCWDSTNHWRIVLVYIDRVVLLREGHAPSIIELPFPLDGSISDHMISREGNFIVALLEGSRWDSLESYTMIDVDRGRTLGYAPIPPDAIPSESQGSEGETYIRVTSIGGVVFDQGVFIVSTEGHTLICRAGDSSPERLSWDTLAVEMEPLGINDEGLLLALSQDSSLILPSGPSFETDSFLALCTVSSDGDFSWTEIDPRDWNIPYLYLIRDYFDPTSMTVFIWNSYIGQMGISSAVTGESIWGPVPIEEPYIYSLPVYAPGGSYFATRGAYIEPDPGSVLLYPLDTTEEPVILSGDAGCWTLGPLLVLSASGHMLWDLYLPGEQPLGQSAGYLRRRALVSPEGRLLWLGPARLMRSHNDGSYEAISDDGLSFIWSDDRQIQICRLVSDQD